MSSHPKLYFTPQEYLEIDRKSEFKSEYIDGQIVAMTGASREHNLIVTNIVRELSLQLKGRPCELYPSDMRVRVPATGDYAYPDAVVVCGEPQFEDGNVDILVNPTLIIEVLSDSTESYDRGKKFRNYRSIKSLAEYVLVAQDDYRIEQFVRQTNGQWLLTETRSSEGVVELETIECKLLLKEVYDKVAIP
jgi:Uma2 family endonuclease